MVRQNVAVDTDRMVDRMARAGAIVSRATGLGAGPPDDGPRPVGRGKGAADSACPLDRGFNGLAIFRKR